MLVMLEKREGLTMERMNDVIEIARSSHHVPFVLSFLLGVFLIKKERRIEEVDDPVIGDNVPAIFLK